MGLGQARRVLAAQRAEHDALFRAHYPTVVAFLACRVPVEDAKDLGAEVFVEAWRQRDHVIVDEDRGWLPWLFTVARRMSNAWLAAQLSAGARNARMVLPDAEDFTARVVEVDAANQQLSAAIAAMLVCGVRRTARSWSCVACSGSPRPRRRSPSGCPRAPCGCACTGPGNVLLRRSRARWRHDRRRTVPLPDQGHAGDPRRRG